MNQYSRAGPGKDGDIFDQPEWGMTIKKGTPRLILDIGTYRFANLLIQQHGEWRSYYDEETSELVRTQERFIVERFGYKGPSG